MSNPRRQAAQGSGDDASPIGSPMQPETYNPDPQLVQGQQQEEQVTEMLNLTHGRSGVAASSNVNINLNVAPDQVAAEGEAGTQQKKRGRNDSAGASGSGVKKNKKKGELVNYPQGPPTCQECGRAFHTWKAVFGHMRMHKVGEDRSWSGAFPPPVITPPGSPVREQEPASLQENVVPTLQTVAQDQGLARLDFDLNQVPEPIPPPVEGFDLNKTPPEDEGYGDGDGAAGSL